MHARQLRTAWTDAWEPSAGPGALGMPLQNILTSEANSRIARSGRKDIQFAPVGQIVGRMNQVQSVRDVMYGLVEEYIETVERQARYREGQILRQERELDDRDARRRNAKTSNRDYYRPERNERY